MLETEIFETDSIPDACVIWLHGLGADGHDFAPIVPELNLPAETRIRFLFPHAPMQAVTINGGYVMRAWYDILAPNITAEQDANGIKASQQQLEELIADQVLQGIRPERIILAGFSQGGAIALYTGLRHLNRLAGIMALSTYLPLMDTTEEDAASNNQDIDIFMAHGIHDAVVPLDAAVISRRKLQQLGYPIQWHEYPMEHSLCADEIVDISQWLQTRLPVL
jgi:phospholipase/carboxylesterase